MWQLFVCRKSSIALHAVTEDYHIFPYQFHSFLQGSEQPYCLTAPCSTVLQVLSVSTWISFGFPGFLQPFENVCMSIGYPKCYPKNVLWWGHDAIMDPIQCGPHNCSWIGYTFSKTRINQLLAPVMYCASLYWLKFGSTWCFLYT